MPPVKSRRYTKRRKAQNLPAIRRKENSAALGAGVSKNAQTLVEGEKHVQSIDEHTAKFRAAVAANMMNYDKFFVRFDHDTDDIYEFVKKRYEMQLDYAQKSINVSKLYADHYKVLSDDLKKRNPSYGNFSLKFLEEYYDDCVKCWTKRFNVMVKYNAELAAKYKFALETLQKRVGQA